MLGHEVGDERLRRRLDDLVGEPEQDGAEERPGEGRCRGDDELGGRTPDEAEEHRRPVTPRIGEVAADDARGDRRDAEAGEREGRLGGSRTQVADEQHAEEGHREAAEPVDAPGGDEHPQLGRQGRRAGLSGHGIF